MRVTERLPHMHTADGDCVNRVAAGPVFVTAIGVLMLEIPYRFLPIFQR